MQARKGRHGGLLVMVTISLAMSMALSQDYNFEVGGLQYYLLILPAAFLPLLNFGEVMDVLLTRARALLAFLVIAGVWHLMRGDARAVLQLGLLVWVSAWISTRRAAFDISDLISLYFLFVGIGAVVWVLSDFNGWGLLPGTTTAAFGDWRVSFFPNIANTGILSLAMFFLLTKDVQTARSHPIALGVVTYFLILSFVRTAIIGATVYVILRLLFTRYKSLTARQAFWAAIALGVGINLMIASSVLFLVGGLQKNPLVSRFLLQSAQHELSPQELLVQIYRPWLWGQHLSLFASSPWMMGWGAFDFIKIRPSDLISGHGSQGTESLPTRLLAGYGLAAFFYLGYFVSRLRQQARQADFWAVACFPAMMLLVMNWGSAFHPTSPMFILVLLISIKGSSGFFDSRAVRHSHAT